MSPIEARPVYTMGNVPRDAKQQSTFPRCLMIGVFFSHSIQDNNMSKAKSAKPINPAAAAAAAKAWIQQQIAERENAKPAKQLEAIRGDLEAAIKAGLTAAELHAGVSKSGFPVLSRTAFSKALVEMGLIQPRPPRAQK